MLLDESHLFYYFWNTAINNFNWVALWTNGETNASNPCLWKYRDGILILFTRHTFIKTYSLLPGKIKRAVLEFRIVKTLWAFTCTSEPSSWRGFSENTRRQCARLSLTRYHPITEMLSIYVMCRNNLVSKFTEYYDFNPKMRHSIESIYVNWHRALL